jgi:hypothetical protein
MSPDAFGERFTPVERATFRFAVTHTADTLVDLIRSRSYYLAAPPERRAEIDQAVRSLAQTHPDLAGREGFELPYVTYAYRATFRS